MKRFLLFLFGIVISANCPSFADGGMWDRFGDQNVYGQEAVTQQDFEKALESKRGKAKKKNKDIPKGESFSQSNETDIIHNISEELPVMLVPVALKVKEGYTVPVGHYQVEGEKEDGNAYIKLYQAHDLIAKIPAEETNDDFGEPTIIFAKLLPHGDYHVQLIYGGLDFNAYAIVDTE